MCCDVRRRRGGSEREGERVRKRVKEQGGIER